MKANPRSLVPSPMLARLARLAGLSPVLLAAACVPAPPAQAPAPAPRHHPAPPPPATPTPAPSAADWRDAPITPGDWQLSSGPSGSTATFAGGQFAMRCDPARHLVTLVRAANLAPAARSMTVTTESATRAIPVSAAQGAVQAVLAARDPLLDAMAFSRGRFAVSVAGLPPLYVPSWTEVSRVIEDCRQGPA